MADLGQQFDRDGFVVFDADPRAADWASAAFDVARAVAADPVQQSRWRRHGQTWFVGVDALPNRADGSIGEIPLAGPWTDLITPPDRWHRAQVSVVYEGYPEQDPSESDSAHRFRLRRDAAHVDGLHLEDGRRIVREPHDFILGLPLNASTACPLVVWGGSHRHMRTVLRGSIGGGDPIGSDVTDVYTATRRTVFDTCPRIEITMQPGQAVLVHRLALHGVAPSREGDVFPDDGRMVAYFRPLCTNPSRWLAD